MAQTVRFGVIGLGMGALRCPVFASTAGAQLVAVSDLNETRGKNVAAQFNVEWYKDYRSLLDRKDIDVVVVMTPTGLL